MIITNQKTYFLKKFSYLYTKNLFLLNITTEEILLMSHSLTYQLDFLEFYLQNPFQTPVLWQITWNQHNVTVYKSTLLKNRITEKNSSIWEISREEGCLNLQELLTIIQKIQKIALPANFYCEKAGRDGHFYRLTLGDSFTNITYKWYEVFVPDEWEILNEYANNLQKLLKNWVGNVKKMTTINYTEEETDKGFSIFIENNTI